MDLAISDGRVVDVGKVVAQLGAKVSTQPTVEGTETVRCANSIAAAIVTGQCRSCRCRCWHVLAFTTIVPTLPIFTQVAAPAAALSVPFFHGVSRVQAGTAEVVVRYARETVREMATEG